MLVTHEPTYGIHTHTLKAKAMAQRPDTSRVTKAKIFPHTDRKDLKQAVNQQRDPTPPRQHSRAAC